MTVNIREKALPPKSVRKAACAIALMLVPATALAQAAPAAKPAPAAATVLPDARAILMNMANYLAKLPGFETTLVSSHDSVQPDGQKIEFNEIRSIALSRPNRLRIDQAYSDGTGDLLLFTGKSMIVHDNGLQVYAEAEQPGSVDDAIVYFLRDLKMRLPLARMLTTRLPNELASAIRSAEYVERSELLGVGSHHLAVRGDEIDIQVWVLDDAAKPVPMRVVITYKTEPGEPQFRAQFTDWKTAAPTDATLYQFTPPKDATKIVFGVQAKAAAEGAAANAAIPAKESTK